jgi:hypothetical protein
MMSLPPAPMPTSVCVVAYIQVCSAAFSTLILGDDGDVTLIVWHDGLGSYTVNQ